MRKFTRNPPDWAWMREGLQTLITEPVYSVGRKSVSAATVKLIGLTIRTLADALGVVENITQEKIAVYASVERSTVTRAVTVLNAVGLFRSHRVGRRWPASHAYNIGLLRTPELRARAAADRRRDVASGHILCATTCAREDLAAGSQEARSSPRARSAVEARMRETPPGARAPGTEPAAVDCADGGPLQSRKPAAATTAPAPRASVRSSLRQQRTARPSGEAGRAVTRALRATRPSVQDDVPIVAGRRVVSGPVWAEGMEPERLSRTNGGGSFSPEQEAQRRRDLRAQAVQIGATNGAPTPGAPLNNPDSRRTLALAAADQLATREERDEAREDIDYETDAKRWRTRQGPAAARRPGDSRACCCEGCGLPNPGTSCPRCGHGNSGQLPSADQNNGHEL